MKTKHIANRLLFLFKNLDAIARVTQVFRLVACVGCVSFLIAVLAAPAVKSEICIARLDCSHLDVSLGLYKSLRNEVSGPRSRTGDSRVPIDASLTNSEISILSQYSKEQVKGAPEVLYFSLYNWCRVKFLFKGSEEEYEQHLRTGLYNKTVECTKSGSQFFDYRSLLADVGFKGILAYAYHTSNFNNPHWNKIVGKREKKNDMVFPGIVISLCFQFLVLLLTIFVYYKRILERKGKFSCLLYQNMLALTSLVSLIALAVLGGLITRITVDMRSEIKHSLGDFGMSLRIGSLWFLLLWFAFGFAFLSCFSWTFPLWCGNPPEDLEEMGSPGSDHWRSENNPNKMRSFWPKIFTDSGRNPDPTEVTDGSTTFLNNDVAMYEKSDEDHDSYSESQVPPLHNTISADDSLFSQEHHVRALSTSLSRKDSVRQTTAFPSRSLSSSGRFPSKNLYETMQTGSLSQHHGDTSQNLVQYPAPLSKERFLASSLLSPIEDQPYSTTNRQSFIPSKSLTNSKPNTRNFTVEDDNAFDEGRLPLSRFQHNIENNPFVPK